MILIIVIIAFLFWAFSPLLATVLSVLFLIAHSRGSHGQG